MSDPQPSSQEPLSLEQKRIQSTREFLKMKRNLKKEEKSNQQTFTYLMKTIESNDHKLFNQEITRLKPEMVLHFLFSEDDLKSTPYQQLISHPQGAGFLQVLNEWALVHQDCLSGQFQVESNTVWAQDWQSRYLRSLRHILSWVIGRQQSSKDIVELLGKKTSIFHLLSIKYLNFERIVQTAQQSQNQTLALERFYLPLLNHSELSLLSELAQCVNSYLLIIRRDTLWTTLDFHSLIAETSQFDLALLELRELDYNFWHELALSNPVGFIKTCSMLEECQLQQSRQQQLQDLLSQADRSGETPFDKCIRTWKYIQIQQIMNKYLDIPALFLTTSCLNKVLYNRKLSQQQKEQLILKFLAPEMLVKGYLKIVPQKKEICISGRAKLNGSKSHLFKEQKTKLITTMNYTSVLCYSSIELKTAIDPAGLYPLASYLMRYKHRADIKLLNALWLTPLNRKDLKKLSLLFMRDQQERSIFIDFSSAANQEFEILYKYYQPIWKTMSYMEQGETFEYLVRKCYFNISQIQVLKASDQIQANFMGPHFLRSYLLNSSSLADTPANQLILRSVLQSSPKEKHFGAYRLQNQLVRSLYDIECLHISEEYVPATLRNQLKIYLHSLQPSEYLKEQALWSNQTLLQWVARPLLMKRVKQSGIINLQQILLKIGHEEMINYIQRVEQGGTAIERTVKQLFIQIIKQTGRSYKKNKKLFNNLDSIRQIQAKYSSTELEDANTELFSGAIHKPLEQLVGTWRQHKPHLGTYFRLRPHQHHLQTKITQLLSAGCDPYFSRYCKHSLHLQTISQEAWKRVLTRMHLEHCSFLAAFLCEQTVCIEDFRTIFISYIQKHSDTKIRWFLFERTLRVKQILGRKSVDFYNKQPYFIDTPKSIWNIKLVLDLIELGNSLSQHRQFELTPILALFFRQNVEQYLRQLTPKQHNSELKQNSVGNELQKYLKKWLPIISMAGVAHEDSDGIFKEIFVPLMKLCQQRGLSEPNKIILQATDYHQILNSDLSITKLNLCPDSQQQYIDCLWKADPAKLKSWLNYFCSYANRPLLSKALCKFNTPRLLQIIRFLTHYYQGLIAKASEEDKNLPEKVIGLILVAYRAVPVDNRIEAFLEITKQAALQLAMKGHTRSMLMSAHHTKNATAALVLLDPTIEMVFYLKEAQSVKEYTQLDFYSKSSQSSFDTYILNLRQYHSHCADIYKHLDSVTTVLVESELWDRLAALLNISELQSAVAKLVFLKLYEYAGRELIVKTQTPAVTKIVKEIFQIYKQSGQVWKDEVFRAGFYLNPEEAMSTMRPEIITLSTLRACVKHHPAKASLLFEGKTQLDHQTLPEKRLSNLIFPLMKHYVHDHSKQPWLVDELRLQNKMLEQVNLGDMRWLLRTKQAWRSQNCVLPYWHQLYSQYPEGIFWELVCKDILRNKHIKQLGPFQKYYPQMRSIIRSQLANRNTPLTTVNPQLLTSLIKQKTLSAQNLSDQLSIVLRLIKAADLQNLQLYISFQNISLNRQCFDAIELNLNITFLQTFFSIQQQPFLIKFIEQYDLLKQYAIEEWSPSLLAAACTYRFNKLLQFAINYVKHVYKVNPVFAAAPGELLHKITSSGTFYLPVTLARDFNFYEAYFLIRQSNNESPAFKSSGRFISHTSPDAFQFIPELQRRIKLNNLLMSALREARSLSYRTDLILPCLFELQGKGQGSNSYERSLIEFLSNLISRHFKVQNAQGIFQKLALMTLAAPQTHIPEIQLEKIYPAEMQVIKLLKDQIKTSYPVPEPVSLLKKVSQFRPLLLHYNPVLFLSEVLFIQQLTGIVADYQTEEQREQLRGKVDRIEYLRGVQVNLDLLQQRNLITEFIHRHFFQESITLFSSNSSLNLKRQVLLLLLINLSLHSRRWQECSVYQALKSHQEENKLQEEYMLYQLAMHLNSRVGNSITFDLSLWNKIAEQMAIIENSRSVLNLQPFKAYFENCQKVMIQHYQQILLEALKTANINCEAASLRSVFSSMCRAQTTKCRREGLYLQLALLMNACFLQSECRNLRQQIDSFKESSALTDISLSFTDSGINSAQLTNKGEVQSILIQVRYAVDEGLVAGKSQAVLLQLNFKELIDSLSHDFYLLKIKNKQLNSLNQFFAKADRHTFFKDYTFKIDINSFENIKETSKLRKMFEEDALNGNSITARVLQDIQNLQELLQGFRNVKLYNMSDIFGPINFHQETDNLRIIHALSFYQLLPLPKTQPIVVRFQNSPPGQANATMLKHLEEYFAYYIKASRDEPSQVSLSNELIVYEIQGKDGSKVQLSWQLMGPWTVASFTTSVVHYCSELHHKIDGVLDVRLSFLSLIELYKQNLRQGTNLPIKIATEKFLYNSSFCDLLERILLMVTEDIGNIMSIVKGIIIKFQINSDRHKVANIIICQNTSVTAVDYEVKQSLLDIIFQITIKTNLNKDNKTDEVSALVSRKAFLDSVFASAQFLTDYFLLKSELDRECLNIGTSITKRLNTTTHLHINYQELYKYVQKLRNQEKPIREIEGLLTKLKHYLHSAMERTIIQYISSQELANRHQILLLDKCESINTSTSLREVQTAKQLVYDSLQREAASGLKEIEGIMNEIGSQQIVKNSFLVQIYKSYYSVVVAQGMTFLVGYQSSNKKSQVITIRKAENINQINIVELDFLLLVTKTLPTQDELNRNKIIRIFITDYNHNLYKISVTLQNYLLSLPDDHEQRNMARFAPIVPPDLNITFKLPEQPIRHQQNDDTKLFYIQLPPFEQKPKEDKQRAKTEPQNKDYRLKLRPFEEQPVATISFLKKSPQLKDAVNRLSLRLAEFVSESIKIVIEPPASSPSVANVNLEHLISLVCTDFIQTLNRFEYDQLRNPALDIKLSVQNQMPLNQNSLISLRKRLFVKHFQNLRIAFASGKSGITMNGNELRVIIDIDNTKVLPSSAEYLSIVVQQLIKRQKKQIDPTVRFQSQTERQSAQVLLKMLDLISIIPFQKEQLQIAQSLLKLSVKKTNIQHSLMVCKRKAQITFENDRFTLAYNIQTPEREFYPAQMLVQTYYQHAFKAELPQSFPLPIYIPLKNEIEVHNSSSNNYQVFTYNKNKKIVDKLETKAQSISSYLQKVILNIKPEDGTRYFVLDQHYICASNYFHSYSEEEKGLVRLKHHEGYINQPNYLLLTSPKPINLDQCTINLTKRDPINKENVITQGICHSQFKDNVRICLIAANTFRISLTSAESAFFAIHSPGLLNPFAGTDTNHITIVSNAQMDLSCTKYLELQIYKKKPVVIKERQNNRSNLQFKETNEVATPQMFKQKIEELNNIENLVYVINDDCKRYLTRAGEPRTDYIQLCDANHNPINYHQEIDVKLVHINRLAIITPQLVKRGMQIGLKWTPTVRGHYYLYINSLLMNPNYELGVCAGQADHTTTKVTPPKVTKLCFCEESEIMLDLRDAYGNIYSQLEEQILGDELLIDLQADKLGGYLKIEKSQINKYGLKKVKFNFSYTQGQANVPVAVDVLLNRQHMLHFQLEIEGYSLKQRKKLLDQDISSKDKRFYKQLLIHRGKFLEEIIMHAQKSLHCNLSIKFANEPGIDAGGVKREFYDLIGNQIKSDKNPFFRVINNERMEYFFNPDILKNKKKEDYMEVWGKYLANSFLNSYLIGVTFSPVFVKMLYGTPISYEDLLQVCTEDERKQYSYLLTASPQQFEDLCLDFTAIVDKKKAVEIELKPDGKNMPVTADNVKEYLQLTAQVLLTDRYKDILEAFRRGFASVLELDLIKKWIRPQEFWCLTAGTKELTAEIVLNYITFQGHHIQNVSGWFRRYISEASREILVGFLKFSSGSSSIDFSLTSKITVTFQSAGDNPKKLPISHTCWKEIVIPKYKSYEIMHKLLNAAFIYCSEGFGFG